MKIDNRTVEAWQAVTAALAVAFFVVHIAALAGGAYITRSWNDRSVCEWAPASWLLGAGIAVVALPFLVSGLSQMLTNPADKSVFLTALIFALVEVFGALVLFHWAPLWCANHDLWWIALSLFILDAVLLLVVCISYLFVKQLGGYRVVFQGSRTVLYEAVPT